MHACSMFRKFDLRQYSMQQLHPRIDAHLAVTHAESMQFVNGKFRFIRCFTASINILSPHDNK
jgi:hypothetical protein